MAESLSYRPKAVFALGGIVLAIFLTFLLGSPAGAMASESNYCFNQGLGSHGRCVGSGRELNALYGQGNQHSVCIWASQMSNGNGFVNSIRCSGGAGQGIYNPIEILAWFYPVIENNATGSNTVFGVAYRP